MIEVSLFIPGLISN